MSLGHPQHDVGLFEQWDDESFRKVHCGPYAVEASGPRLVENFLDVAHFPFVHQGLLGDPAHPDVSDYVAEIGPQGVTARDISVWQPDPDGTGQGARVTYTYRVHRPLTASFVWIGSRAAIVRGPRLDTRYPPNGRPTERDGAARDRRIPG